MGLASYQRLIFDPDGDLLLLLSSQSCAGHEVEGDSTAEATKEAGPLDISMLVSSKHMMLASRIFKAMLSATFSEGLALRSAGKLELPLPSDDPDAFEILLGIIHGRSKSVPRQVNLDLLSRLAIAVDKYELQEAVEVYSEAWIKSLQDTFPTCFTSDIPRWLLISWVFEKTLEFERATKIFQLESISVLEEGELCDLPIPISIIDALNKSRQEAIRRAISTISNIVIEYHSPKVHCQDGGDRGFICDSLTLGALIKGSIKIGIWPTPDPPYNGRSFMGLVESIGKLELPQFCTGANRIATRGRVYSHNDCGKVMTNIEDSIQSLKGGLRGLKLESFRKSSSR